MYVNALLVSMMVANCPIALQLFHISLWDLFRSQAFAVGTVGSSNVVSCVSFMGLKHSKIVSCCSEQFQCHLLTSRVEKLVNTYTPFSLSTPCDENCCCTRTQTLPEHRNIPRYQCLCSICWRILHHLTLPFAFPMAGLCFCHFVCLPMLINSVDCTDVFSQRQTHPEFLFFISWQNLVILVHWDYWSHAAVAHLLCI